MAATAAGILRERDLLSRLAAGTSGVVGGAFLRRLVTELAGALDGELHPTPDELQALQVFAARAAAELERRRHETALRVRADELASSRARALQAADEERRRIGRDLHDGAQQRLVVLGQALELALRELERDPQAAAARLSCAREQAALAGRELRELARGLHPVGLEKGLPHALAALAVQSPIPLHIETLPERRLPPVVDVTIWFLVSEALSNAIKQRTARQPFLEFGHDGDGGRGARKLAEIIAGERTSAVSLACEWDLEGGPPRIGQRLPVFDHTGRCHATVEVVRVAVLPFGDVDPATIDAEPGEPDWHAGRRRAYGECQAELAALLGDPDWRLADTEPMVILWYRLVDQPTAAAVISGSTL